MGQLHNGVCRNPAPVACAVLAALMIGAAASPLNANADVTATSGSAYGYLSSVSVFGGPPSVTGPTPTVTLPTSGSATPITATAPSGNAQAGPAKFFTSGPITVSTQGTTGPGGSVTSSTNIQTVNTSGTEVFTASNVASTCTASQTGLTGSTTITNGTLQTDSGNDINGDDDFTGAGEHPPVSINVPTNPAPNTTFEGHIHVGGSTDNFQYIFNEQTINPDGSITVFAAHQRLLGPTAVGDLRVGKAQCGVTPTGDTTPPETTITASVIKQAERKATFRFTSNEAGSTFRCRLDQGTYQACSSPKTYRRLEPGRYAFRVRATDAAGNTDASPAVERFRIEN